MPECYDAFAQNKGEVLSCESCYGDLIEGVFVMSRNRLGVTILGLLHGVAEGPLGIAAFALIIIVTVAIFRL